MRSVVKKVKILGNNYDGVAGILITMDDKTQLKLSNIDLLNLIELADGYGVDKKYKWITAKLYFNLMLLSHSNSQLKGYEKKKVEQTKDGILWTGVGAE